jgi:hypothetical protein
MWAETGQVLQSLRDRATFQAQSVPDGDYNVAGEITRLETQRLIQAVRKVCPDDLSYANQLSTATNTLRRYLPLASSPAAMMLAWSWRESVLSSGAALHLAEAGGVLVPKSQSDRFLQPGQKGLIVVENCLFGIRHAPGNYPDSCDLNGRLIYQPTVNQTGPTNHLSLVRFRWAELLASQSLPGSILLLIMWLKYPSLGQGHDTVMMLCPALVESLREPWSENIAAPLQLRLVSRYEAAARTNHPLTQRAELDAAASRN